MARIPRKTPRLVLHLAAGIAKAVLVAAGVLALATLVLMVIWWRVVSWPYRNAEPRRRSHVQREALVALVTAIGTILATRKRGTADPSSALAPRA